MGDGGYVRHAFPGYRVFIFGMEVTQDVVAVDTHHHPDQQPNVANIKLLSPQNRYFITDADIIKIAQISKNKSNITLARDMSITPGSAWYNQPSDVTGAEAGDLQPSFATPDPIKSKILSVKTSVPSVNVDLSKDYYYSALGNYISPQNMERYPFQSGKPIFHPMDPVRIFRRDEFRPSLWYHWFTGVISDMSDKYDKNQEHELTIGCEDPSKMLRYARFTANPGLIDISQMAIRDAITADVVARTVFAELFNNRSLPEILCAMIFGERAFSSAYAQAVIDKTKQQERQRGSVKPVLAASRSLSTAHRSQLTGHTISDDDARLFAEQAGFTGEDVDIIVAIAHAESSMRPDVVLDLIGPDPNNPKVWTASKRRTSSEPPAPGTVNSMYGIFQVNKDVWIDKGIITEADALSPSGAFKAAAIIAERQGYDAWQAYNGKDVNGVTGTNPKTGKPRYMDFMPNKGTITQSVSPQERKQIQQHITALGKNRKVEIPQEFNDSAQDWVTETIYGAWGSARLGRRKWGIGHTNFKASRVWLYDNTSADASGIPPGLSVVTNEFDAGMDINLLEAYQTNIDCVISTSDLEQLKAEYLVDNIRLDQEIKTNPTTEDIITEIGMHPELYPVDGGRLMMLLPPGVTGSNREITYHDPISSFALNTEWKSRAEIIFLMLSRIEFVFYVTPRGDYCIEFPLYDFEPSDFGKYGEDYIIKRHDTVLVDSVFTDNKVMTQLTMAPQFLQNFKFAETIANIINRTTVTLWPLIPMFGVRTAPITSKGYVASLEGANLYTHMALNRTNADAYTQKVHIMPNINLWLNRPVLIDVKSHIGTVKSIRHSIKWGLQGSVDTNIDLNMMRGWDGSVDAVGKRIYTPIGGMASRPLNYKEIFQKNKKTKQTTITPAVLASK